MSELKPGDLVWPTAGTGTGLANVSYIEAQIGGSLDKLVELKVLSVDLNHTGGVIAILRATLQNGLTRTFNAFAWRLRKVVLETAEDVEALYY